MRYLSVSKIRESFFFHLITAAKLYFYVLWFSSDNNNPNKYNTKSLVFLFSFHNGITIRKMFSIKVKIYI